ncbi:putative Ig domain-containing protein [Frateuria sp. GZRR33]|uniref:putative Ig domain-containing protein n=1 Tax=Frateuria sp. GZRR33 TaxID=3351535 RepID=UPI003EDB740C
MARWVPFQLVGGAYADDALPWSAQDCVNYLPVPAEKAGTRSQSMLRGLPGLAPMSLLGTAAPIRGMRNVEGRLFVVSGQSLFSIGLDGTPTELGTIPGVTRCSMSHNQITGGNEVVISNGQSGYVYNTAANTLSQITDDGFPGAISFDFVDGYVLGIEPARRFAFTSDLAAAGSYSTLDRYEAEGSPDLLVGQAVTHREWWLMGERTIEPFTNTGAATGTFQRSQGTVIEVGLAATHAVAVMDNSVFWLGSDGIVYRANGYTPQRISTHAIEQAIARCNMAQAFAFTFEDKGHKVFYLTFPDGQTWGYDAATGEWHRRKSHNLDRWRINCLVKWRGKWIAGDYANGILYQLDWDTQDENGEPMERRRITGVTHDNQNAIVINGLELVVDTGLPPGDGGQLLVPPLSLAGHLQASTQGETVTYQYTRKGGVQPVTIALASGALPTGLSISAAGKVTGTITAGGSFSWTLRATDALGNTCDLDDSAVVTSTDILTYATVNDGLNQTPSSVAVSDGIIFVGCNNSSATISTDKGATWTLNDVTGIVAQQSITAAIKYGGNWYAFASGSAARCVGDSFSFAGITRPANGVPCAAEMGGSLYVSQTISNGANTVIAKMATDAPTWTTVDFGGAYGEVRAMVGTGSAYLFATSTGVIVRSADLVTFTPVKTGTGQVFSGMAYLGAIVVATSSGGTHYVSTDHGLTWDAGSASPALSYVCATPSMFIGARVNSVYTSTDGVNWTLRHSAPLTGAGTQYNGGAASDGTTACFPRQSNWATVGTA